MAIEEACGWCGEWFVKRGNKKYCCKECSELAGKQVNKLYYMKKHGKKNAKVTSNLSMQEMINLMDKLSKERGRVVQYGELQSMIYNGEIKLKGGAVK